MKGLTREDKGASLLTRPHWGVKLLPVAILLLFVLSPVAYSGIAGAATSAKTAPSQLASTSSGHSTQITSGVAIPQNPEASGSASLLSARNGPLSPPDPPGAEIVQQASGYFGESNTFMIPFGSSVASGDVVVVGVGSYYDTVTSVTDSLSSSYTLTASATRDGVTAYVYYAALTSSGSDTITVKNAAPSEGEAIFIYEVSGASVSKVGSATGDGATPPVTISTSSSVSFDSGAFLLGMIGGNEYPSATAGSGFTLAQNSAGAAEYCQDCGLTSPTDFPATTTISTALDWAEVGIALEPATSLAGTSTGVVCSPNTVDVGVSTICTATVTGSGSGSPTPTGTITFSATGTGAFSAASGSTFTSPDECTLATTGGITSCSVTFTPASGGEGTQTIGGQYSGDGSNAPSSGSTTLTVDQRSSSTGVSCSSPLEAGTSEECTITVTDTDSGTPIAPVGTVTVTDTEQVFGSEGATCALTASSSSVSSCMVAYAPSVSLSGSDSITASFPGDTDHLSSYGMTSVTITAPPPSQVEVSITLNQFYDEVLGYLGTPLSSTNYFTVTYTSSGATETADQTGGTLDLLVDQNTVVTISADSSNSNNGNAEEWCLQGTGGVCVATTIDAGTTSVSVTYVYYDIQEQFVDYAVIGGGTPAAPDFGIYATAPLAPTSTSEAYDTTTGPLSTSSYTTIWALAGTVEVFTPVINTNPSSAPLQQWQGVPTCAIFGEGPVSCGSYVSDFQVGPFSQGGIFITMNYYHQYAEYAQFFITGTPGSYTPPTIDYTSAGSPATQVLTLGTQTTIYADAGSSWSAPGELAGSTSTEQWPCTNDCSGTIPEDAPLDISPVYTHQYLVTFGAVDLWDCENPATEVMYLCSQAQPNVIGTISPAGAVWEDAGIPFEVSQTPSEGVYTGYGPTCGSTPCFWTTSNPAGITFAEGCTSIGGNTCETQFTVEGTGVVAADFGIPNDEGSEPVCGAGAVASGGACICPLGSVLYGGQCVCDGIGCAGMAGWGISDDPAYVLVTAPDGISQVGCNAGGDPVDTLTGAAVSTCSGGTGLILITDPPIGKYTIMVYPVGASSSYSVTLFSTAISGGTIDETTFGGTCASADGCGPFTVTLGSDGSLSVSSGTTPPPGVPQFGLAAPLVAAIGFLALVLWRRKSFSRVGVPA